jgi:hypothetical protein
MIFDLVSVAPASPKVLLSKPLSSQVTYRTKPIRMQSWELQLKTGLIPFHVELGIVLN